MEPLFLYYFTPLVIPWLIFAGLSAGVAERKGNSKLGWFAVGVIFGPIGMLAALVAPNSGPRAFERRCPFCCGIVHKDAIICMYCHNEIHNIESAQS